MNDQQLLRYSRQIMLPQIDVGGQQKLLDSRVLVMGAGGLGCPAAMYLATAGVGKLVIVDDDVVDLSNLQRQIGHTSRDIGVRKTESLRSTLKTLNPECQVETVNQRLDDDALGGLVQQVDLVLDCTDNYESRYAINRACVGSQTPLVSGAAIRFAGQVLVYRPNQAGPCYQCLYPDTGEEEETCSENGVLAPLVGIIGSLQAVEAVKLLLCVGEPLSGRLLILDALAMQWREMRVSKDPECPVCSAG